jgi:hypothetical protein
MNDVENLCYSIAFLIGIAGGWEMGGYRFTRRAFESIRDRIRRIR